MKTNRRGFDLKKRYPDFFSETSKIIFNIAFIICAVLIFISIAIDGTSRLYISCPIDTPQGKCSNPYYDPFCNFDDPFCKDEYLYPGQSIGELPSTYSKNVSDIVVSILLLAILINYIAHDGRKKNAINKRKV